MYGCDNINLESEIFVHGFPHQLRSNRGRLGRVLTNKHETNDAPPVLHTYVVNVLLITIIITKCNMIWVGEESSNYESSASVWNRYDCSSPLSYYSSDIQSRRSSTSKLFDLSTNQNLMVGRLATIIIDVMKRVLQ